MRRLAVALAALLFACAQPSPPTGGPVDDSPPSIHSTEPALFASSVPLGAPLRIVFDEAMDRGSVEDALLIRPHVDYGRRFWREDTLTVLPLDGWEPETTYTVLVRRGAADRRGNGLAESALLVFSTGERAARGRVSGRLNRINVSEGEVWILAFTEWTADTTKVDPLAAVSIADPDQTGRFLLPGLEPGRRYEVGAFYDVNENRDFDPGRDLYCRALQWVVPDAGGGPDDVDVTLVFADEPGRLEATIIDSTCLALGELRRAREAEAAELTAARDSLLTLQTTLRARADSLFGEAVAPEAEGESADSLRARAEELRSEASRISPPDSTAIASLAFLTEVERSDSLYCAAEVFGRFQAVGDTVRLEDRQFGDAPTIAVSDVAPGRYVGAVWRDLVADGRFDAASEPGRDSIRIWVPPGQVGLVDTLLFERREKAE